MYVSLNKLRISHGVIKKIKPYLNLNSFPMLYFIMIQSHFQYCVSSWCFSNKTFIDKLQTKANKIIRYSIQLKNEKDITKVLKQCNILMIEQTALLKIKLTQQSLKYEGLLQWNRIPASLRQVKSIKSIVKQLESNKKLKQFLLLSNILVNQKG